MSRRISAVVRCAAAIILLTIAWIDGAGLEFGARAMACCAHRQDCGGDVSAPDKCCAHMGHGASAKTGTIVQSSHLAALVPIAFAAAAPLVRPITIAHDGSLARPHDPPHLHTFALLI